MSDLETAATPILKPLILGDGPQILSEMMRGIAATWTLKTAMMIQLFDGGWSIPKTEPILLYRTRSQLRPLPNTSCWIGMRPASQLIAQSTLQQVVLRLPSDEPTRKPTAYTASTAVGHLVIQIIRIYGLDGDLVGEVSADLERLLVRVWPGRESISWPPSKPIDDDTMDLLADFPFGSW
jgi:hypothetical protein